jgi:hypothetical protein
LSKEEQKRRKEKDDTMGCPGVVPNTAVSGKVSGEPFFLCASYQITSHASIDVLPRGSFSGCRVDDGSSEEETRF